MSIYLHFGPVGKARKLEVAGMHCCVEVFIDIESPVVYSDVSDAQPTICMRWPKLQFRQPSRKSGITLPLLEILRCRFSFLTWWCCPHGESWNDAQRKPAILLTPFPQLTCSSLAKTNNPNSCFVYMRRKRDIPIPVI